MEFAAVNRMPRAASASICGVRRLGSPAQLSASRRIYNGRKQLCRARNLRSILIAGRMPGYHAHADSMTAEDYVRKAVLKDIEDPVINAQLSNGFSIQAVLPDYLPTDQESRGNALLMEWLNPSYTPPLRRHRRNKVRVASVQYQMRPVESFDAFVKKFPDDDLTAQALFWAGESYREAGAIPEAFWRYNRCRTDFPESEAAKYARGRLALPELLAQFDNLLAEATRKPDFRIPPIDPKMHALVVRAEATRSAMTRGVCLDTLWPLASTLSMTPHSANISSVAG